MKKALLPALLFVVMVFLSSSKIGFAQSVLLYKNSFESPLITPSANCGPDIDATLVNTIWGGTGLGTGGGGLFQQQNTVETVLINGPDLQYTDLLGLGGNYCLSMLSSLQNDKAALTLNSQMLPYANISFLMSPIDLAACGGPFGLDTAIMRITVYDSPGGTFSFSSPGTMLDEDTIVGSEPGLTPFTFNWLECSTSLGISSSVDGNITIVFDLLRGGYAAMDSIEINSSVSSSLVEEQDNLKSLIVYPNPFINEILMNGTTAKGEMILFDESGKEIMRHKTFNIETKIKTESVLNGLYFLKYNNGKRTTNFKLMKF
jgi:hypothetical protein